MDLLQTILKFMLKSQKIFFFKISIKNSEREIKREPETEGEKQGDRDVYNHHFQKNNRFNWSLNWFPTAHLFSGVCVCVWGGVMAGFYNSTTF